MIPTPSDCALRIVVCVATRRRPKMLGMALDSLATMRLPPACDVMFLVVENDVSPITREAVKSRAPSFGAGKLHYLLEENVGIPYARNNAIRYAVEHAADLLAFIDDDELASTGWLANLVLEYRKTGALLVGGPVVAADAPHDTTAIEKLVYKGVAQRYRVKARRANKLSAVRKDRKVTITTGNWLGSTRLFTEHGLSFDQSLRFSGGSDAQFYRDVKQKNLSVKWVPEAIVYETVSRERLTPSYQLRRAFDQSTVSFGKKLKKSRLHAFSLLLTVPVRAFGVAILILAIPPTLGGTLVPALRGAGWIAGRLAAVVGRQSRHYENVTGV